ncbi:hypothetical protein DAPPUDRAFT_338308 [Daphnia pulex]|uniref:Uncharacterized protein n=1 Tax=Daphnia pulex TaxID=6669 RepID=E9I2P1_DAPPU|nr:hypothetical protein DAPPUDRAFT_338308 [Daphnia pulex]|eukprot:EFX61740.1 hypothetical protein DAPPUDRAFT_338308 [Daphnia pulex]
MDRYSEHDRLRAEEDRLLEQERQRQEELEQNLADDEFDRMAIEVLQAEEECFQNANEELQRHEEEERFYHKDLDLLAIRARYKIISLNSHVTTDVIPHSTTARSRLASASPGVVIQPSLANRENLSFGALPKRGLVIQSD